MPSQTGEGRDTGKGERGEKMTAYVEYDHWSEIKAGLQQCMLLNGWAFQPPQMYR